MIFVSHLSRRPTTCEKNDIKGEVKCFIGENKNENENRIKMQSTITLMNLDPKVLRA
jgi:hypothetical protein